MKTSVNPSEVSLLPTQAAACLKRVLLLIAVFLAIGFLHCHGQSFQVTTIGDNTVNMLLIERDGDTTKQFIAKLKGSVTSDVSGKVLSLNGSIQSLESQDGNSVKIAQSEVKDGTLIITAEDGKAYIIYDLNSNMVGKIRTGTQIVGQIPNAPQATTVATAAVVQKPSIEKMVPQVYKTKVNPLDGAEMVFIPPGEFQMGDDDLKYNSNPRHVVKLSGFWIYKNLVTVAQYKAFCAATKHNMPAEVVPDSNHVIMESDGHGLHETKYSYVNFNPNWTNDDQPIVNVTWEDAMAYARWASGDLPTEAQWEKAARGTDGRNFPWGDDFDTTKLWCSQKAPFDAGGTHKVGQLGVSPYGCTDMAGNVAQWCKDWFDGEYCNSDHGPDPQGPNSGSCHVLRGEAWDTAASSKVNFRSSHRSGNAGPPQYLNYGVVGFRCALGTDSFTNQLHGTSTSPSNDSVPQFNLTGSWSMNLAFPASGITSMQFDLDLEQKDSTITGTATGKRPVKGSITGSAVSFTVNIEASIPGGVDISYTGNAIDKDTVNGNVNFPGYGAGTWTAKRR